MYKVLILSTTAYHSPFKVGSYHIANSIADKDNTVDFMSAPISIPVIIRSYLKSNTSYRIKYGRQPDRNLRVLRAFNFLPLRFVTSCVNFAHPLFSKSLQNTEYDLILVDSYEWLPFIEKFRFRKVVYRPTDVYSTNNAKILDVEKKFVRAENMPLICMSKYSSEFYKQHGFNVIMTLQNGVHKDFFIPGKFLVSQSESKFDSFRCIYVGAVDDRFDISWLSFLCEAFPNSTFDIYSPNVTNEFRKLQFSNLNYLGPARYADLPLLLRDYDVGLLPFNDNVKNQSRSPMKLYEYLASGLSVFTTAHFQDQLELALVIDQNEPWDTERLRAEIVQSKRFNVDITSILREMDWDFITDNILTMVTDV